MEMSLPRRINMKRSYLTMLVLILLLLSPLSNVVADAQNWTTDATSLPKSTIFVDDSNTQGPWDGSSDYPYQYINDGILHAIDGDTVYVMSGLYNETVVINKSISLRGQQQETTIIDGHNNGSVITVTSTLVAVRRFTVRNSGGSHRDAGVAIYANTTSITDCTIYRARAGILVQNSSETTIKSCRFHTNGFGIFSSSCLFVTIDSCTLYHNGAGVYLYDTTCVTIIRSYADTNGIGFLCEASSNIAISGSAARDNDDNEGGMFFIDCQFVSINNCYLVHNGVGVNLVNSSACFIESCNFSLNTHFSCKFLRSSSSILLKNCVFTQNLRYGLYAENSMFTISWSNIYGNENFGLFAETSAIDASYNWWGTKTGPAHHGLARADRATWDPREITYRPWLTFPMPEIGPDWALEKTFQKPTYIDPWPEQIIFSDPDTDNDGVPDWWETKWGYSPDVWDDHQHLDSDNDSLNNIEECYMDSHGSNPFEKDLFLEFDWTEILQGNNTNKPASTDIAEMIDAFARQNITLHVDTGELGGGEGLPAQTVVSYAEIIMIYWDYFLHNDLNNPRQRIFHYGILCDYSETAGFAVMGWNHLNAFVIGAQSLADNHPKSSRSWLSLAASMHEVGHTCGLIATKYKGIDNRATIKPYYKEFWIYLPYKSILNYLYTYSFMDYSDGSHGRGDFNDWGNLDFSFFKNTRFEYPIT
jgi:parallel beta-helix repeat protein